MTHAEHLILTLSLLAATPVGLEARIWTAADGRTIEADYIRASDTTVTIQRRSGKLFTIKLDSLSLTDREFVARQLSEQLPLGSTKPKKQEKNDYTELCTGEWNGSVFETDLPFQFYADRKLRGGGNNYPLVIYLHGMGSRGTDNQRQINEGIKIFTSAENYRKRPCFIVAPQCPDGSYWNGVPGSNVIKLAKELTKKLPIDRNRIYLTGLSMGGYGTWALLAKEPKLWAAAVPLCGGGDPSKAKSFSKVPIWAFHSSDDDVVDVSESRKMVEALKKAGSTVKYTEYEDRGHGISGAAYREKELMEWIFKQGQSTKD
jgi:predicted peptidase